VTTEVVAASETYTAAARAASIQTLDPTEFHITSVTDRNFVRVYEDGMVRSSSAGRTLYDQLLNSAPQGRCPLCGQRRVSSLDHYLPKALFPVLSVDPFNLVPSCSDCNKAKLDRHPRTETERTLHPYFDDVRGDLWLKAQVVEQQPAALLFSAEGPPSWGSVLQSRVKTHFEVFGLRSLYGSQAAQELSSIRRYLTKLLVDGGSAEVQTYLLDQAESRRHHEVNDWRTASYAAMAASGWFCNGGLLSEG
jgi:hypothetical protein